MKKIVLAIAMSAFLVGACKVPTVTESGTNNGTNTKKAEIKEELPEGVEEVKGTPKNADPRQSIYKGKRYKLSKKTLQELPAKKQKSKPKEE